MDFEKRAGRPIEFRADDDGAVRVSGYAAVFNEEADIGGLFREVIAPGAFRNAIGRGDDVVFLVNHGGLPLARTRSGTLKLTEDDRGLFISSELERSDPDVARIVPKMERGDLDKMSFAFQIPEGGQVWSETEDGIAVRTITDTMLSDVSVVNEPAYGGTSIALRSLEASREGVDKEKERRRRGYAARKAKTEQKIRGIAANAAARKREAE